MFQTPLAPGHIPGADRLQLAPEIGLARARAHEVTGPARAVFAALVAARTTGPVLWLRPAWAGERLTGSGLAGFLDPGRVVFAAAGQPREILWAARQALQGGEVPLVVAELPEPPGLTPVRRLHLAAERGAAAGAVPLALLLTPDPGGAAGVESRWRLAPAPGWARDGAARWQLTRARARMAGAKTWEMRLDDGVPHLG